MNYIIVCNEHSNNSFEVVYDDVDNNDYWEDCSNDDLVGVDVDNDDV